MTTAKSSSRGLAKKKVKIMVNNKMKGAFGRMNPDTNKVEINIIAHKKKGKIDKAELASTIKHELMHVTHPKMTEKQVYRRTAKTKISPSEQSKLVSKLRSKAIHYKEGAMKRKFKLKATDRIEAGSYISKANEIKSMNPRKRTAFMGMI
jgi:hypothetical protein